MGYTLRIGELETSITDDGLESVVYNDAKSETRDDAPAFGEPTDKSNSRWPSYTQWANAMRFIGLHEFMFNKETGLIKNHPDCVPLKKEHKEIIDKAYADFYTKYPNAKAGFSPKINALSFILSFLKQEAPKPCEPYISQMVDECNKAIDAKNDVIEEVKASNDSLRNDKIKDRAFIKEQSDYIKQDSISDAGKDAIAGYMDKKIKRLERRDRLNKIFTKIGVGIAAVATAVCVYVTSFK